MEFGEIEPVKAGAEARHPKDDGFGEVEPVNDGFGEMEPVNDGFGEVEPVESKQDLGFWERKRLELEAKTGDKTSWGELAVNKTVGFGIDELKETVDEYSEQRLMKGEEDNPLKMVELARRIGLTQEQIDRVTARADSGKRSIGGFKLAPNADVLKQGFAELAKAKVAERVRTREAAQQRLANAEEQSTMGAIGSGVVDMASMPLKFANPATIGATTMINIGNRTGALHRDTYTLDENGNPVLVKEGDSGALALAKGTKGGASETAAFVLLGPILRPVGKVISKIPGVGKLFDAATKGVAGAGEKLAAKLGKSEGGRLALKTVDVLGDIEDKIHLGSLPGMVAKTRITEFLDEVVGFNAREGEREKFGEWLGKVTSVEDNVRLLTGLIGFHAITAGVGAYRAHRFNKEFRGTGREEIVGEFIGADRAKKLSNEDLEMMYRIVTSPGLTAEKAGEFLDGLKGDLKAAGEQLQGELARRREVTPEQEEKLDAKIAEYAGGNEAVAEKVKADILSKMQDSRAIDMPEMLDEMVAMSAREYEPESRRMKVHDLRGSGKTEGEKLSGIEELGVTSWEAAETEGLTEKDRFGRYGGGARRALHISIEGTEKLKAAVKAGEISGEMAEELLTAAQCELGARPAEERAALIDGIIDRARGDEALARRMIERLEEEDRGGETQRTLDERLDRAAAEAKVDAIKERNPGASDVEARGAAVEPVETEDGRMTTLGEVVGAGERPSTETAEGRPQSALEGVEMAERLKGTKLKAVGGGWMTTDKFPELRVSVSSEGVEAVGLSAEMMAKPENTADVAAVLAQMTRIAKRNGVGVMFPDQASADIAKAIVREVKEQGLAKAQAKLDTRSKLFNLLFKTALGTGVTYDEAGFKEGLAKVSNGRQFIDKHGNIYGFVDGEGGVHFNPVALNFNTPIHEYGHLALEAIKGFNNKLWQRGMDLVKESDYYREIARQSEIEGHEYSYLKGKVDQICDEALATLIGDRGEKLVTEKGLEAPLKAWLKEFWKAFKGAFGLADLSDEQVERMTLAEFADAVNAELLKGGEFGTKKKIPPSERSVRRYDEAEGSGSNGMLRWKNDRGYLFAIPVDQEKTKPGGKVVFATDDANVTDWIKSRLNGVELRMSKTGKIYVKGRNGLDGELAEIFGRFPKAGQNDGIFDTLAAELGDETWRSATPDKLVEALAKDRANYDKWVEARKSGKTTEQTQLEQRYAEEAEREEAEERERFEKSGMSVIDYVRSRAEEGEPPFDIDWEIAREIAHEEAEGRFAVGGIFTGSSADYDKPSIKFIGTGEGSQVYGWGLYGSTVRDIADGYAHQDAFRKGPKGQQLWQYVVDGKVSDLEEYAAKYGSGAKLAAKKIQGGYTPQEAIESAERFLKETSNPRFKKNAEDSIRFLREHTIEVQRNEAFHEHLYEQTWFTNRKPGDESHLLKWYDAISDANWDRVIAQAEKEGLREKLKGAWWLHFNGDLEHFITDNGNSGDAIYERLSKLLGGPQSASEFLARAGIDGVKYPVDSYGGKGVKNGDEVGWNYVSFRDDNIRVDHKWTDGAAKFSVRKAVAPSKLGDGKQRYYEVPFDKAVDKIVKNRKPVSDEHVFISETPAVFKDIGMPALPVMMNQQHVLSCYFGAAQGVKAGNMHGLGDRLKSLPKSLARPMMIIANETNPSSSVVAIVKMQDKDGHTVIVPVEINGIGRSNEGYVTSNIVKSAFGKKNLWSEKVAKALRDEVDGKVSVFYIDSNEARQISNRLAREAFNFGKSERQLLSGTKGTVHSLSDYGSPVKGVGAQKDSQQFKRWFGDAKKDPAGASKIVDENGEPLRVYRGAEFDPLAQEAGKGVIKPEAYFTADPEYAKRYTGNGGKVQAYYLNIRRPFDIRDPECLADLKKVYPDHEFQKGKSGALDWAEASTIDGEFLKENFGDKYDGIIYDEGGDPGESGVSYRGISYVPLDGGAQVKSATENIGTFDPGNPDVRFHVGKGREDWSWLDEGIFQVKPSLATVAMGDKEQNPAGLAAAVEKREALRPWTKKQSPADLAKPIAFDAADMVMFWRAVSGSLRNPHVQKGESIKGRPSAIGLNVGGDRIEIVSKLFGVIDASDVKTLREACKADGFFQNEDPDWAAKRSKASVQAELDRSNAELDKRTRELFRKRVETGEGGEHYATEVLGHEIGHTLGLLPAGAQLGPVGNAAMTLYKAMEREWKRQISETRQVGDAAKNVKGEITRLIAWWHGQEKMPDYYRKPNEMFAELFGIFLTQPESVQAAAPHAYDACVKIIAGNDKLAAAYRKIAGLKWSGKSNDRVMDEVRKTWEKEAQDQYRKLRQMSRESVSLKRDWFSYALNDRFGPMFNIARRGLAAEKKLLEEAVRTGAMSEAEAKDRLAEKEAEINALKTSLYDWQRQSGGQTRLMIAEFDEVRDAAERDGTSWNDVRDYAHLMRVIELGGRATAHGMDPARASATLEDMQKRMGAAAFANVEKTWKAFRAVYERSVLEDANVREIFDDATMKMLYENKHYVTMKHRMGVEESAEWQRRIEEYRKGNQDAWDPCIDIQERLHRGFGSGGDGEAPFVLYRLEGSLEATEDPIAATIIRAIEIKGSAARNHLLKQMSETLRTLGAKGVYDTAIEKGAKPHSVDKNVYGKLAYMEGGVLHELIVPRVVYRSFKTENMSWGSFGAAMRFIRNTMTLWNPMFINRAYLVDKSALETNLKGMHKAPIDVLSEAFCIRGIGVPLYLANNYLTRFTPIANTWVGKLLWNENTANHYAHQAQKIARICYEGKFGERLSEARELREMGETGKAAEIEQNVAIAKEMLRRNVFQSAYEFNREQAGFDTDAIMQQFGYRIDGGKDPATWRGRVWAKTKAAGRWWNRFEEEQEAVTKIIAYLYEMKKGGNADAVARTVIEQGGTPNLAARGVFASYIENATGFFWNVRKEGALRTVRALKDHPTEWICKNLAQTALPALLKGLMVTGGLEVLIRSLFDDDDEKVKRSWWAPAVIEHARFMNAAMKCVPGYYQRNYNIIPLAKFGDHVLSMRVKYSPEEFAIQNAIHTAFQMFGKDPTDPDADWSTLANGMWQEIIPDIFGRNYLLDVAGVIVGPMIGVNPPDLYRGRKIYDDATWMARWDKPGHMMQEIGKNFWNYSPLGTFTATFKNGQERRLEDTDVPAWIDRVLATPVVSRIPASMLTITSSDTYVKALGRVDQKRRAYAKLVAQDILADCIANGRLGGFDDALKDLPPELRVITIRHVINGWRQYHMDPAAKTLKRMRAIKDPHLKARARQWIEDGMKDD